MNEEEQDCVIAAEVAADEFDRWTEAMDLDVDPAFMDQEDLATFNATRRRLERELMRGSLVINDDGEAVYTPSNKRSAYKNPITFHERTGASVMASDNQKKGRDIAKTYAMMGDMTGLPPKTFAGLAGTDIKVCEAIFTLLFTG